jgi:hypothetical protein
MLEWHEASATDCKAQVALRGGCTTLATDGARLGHVDATPETLRPTAS